MSKSSEEPAARSAIRCEVAFALPDRQFLVTIELPQGATVEDAIEQSGVRGMHADLVIKDDRVGVWSTPCSLSTELKQGDRVELYRPLLMDPKEARRERAKLG